MAKPIFRRGEISRLSKGYRKGAAKMERASFQALTIEGEETFTETQAIVPRRTGHLASTGGTRSMRRGSWLRFQIRYIARYASAVHDRNRNYRNGQWKYVESVMKRRAKGFNQRIGDLTRRLTR